VLDATCDGCWNMYDGNLEKAVATYNAGEGRVDEHNGVPPIAETREYVKRVLK
jgi:soluble lytic murein transglycosylase-like protein